VCHVGDGGGVSEVVAFTLRSRGLGVSLPLVHGRILHLDILGLYTTFDRGAGLCERILHSLAVGAMDDEKIGPDTPPRERQPPTVLQ